MGFKLAFLEIEEGGHRLELTWYKDMDVYKPGEHEVAGGFIPHLAFMPDNFQESLQFHKDMGIVCFESEKRGVYFVKDPDEHWIEIVPRNRAYPDKYKD
jgi:lactoylglutathione lyase